MNNNYHLLPHQPYLEFNTSYQNFLPSKGDPLYNLVWEIYEVSNYNIEKHIALPDACADIMCFYTSYRADCYFIGSDTNLRFMQQLPFCKNALTIFGVKFFPGALGTLIKAPAKEISQQPLLLSDVFSNGLAFTYSLSQAQNFTTRIQIVRQYLYQELYANYERDPLLYYMTHSIIANLGTAKIQTLSAKTGYTDRYLRKKMSSGLGISIKSFSDIIRFQYSYHLYQSRKKNISLTDLAALSGYYDQSHMNLSYKRLTGLSPQKVLELYQKF